MPRPRSEAHPSRNAYHHGCTCDGCKAANAEYIARWRLRTGRTHHRAGPRRPTTRENTR